MAVVNLRISYYRKDGVLVWGPTGFQTFMSSAGNTGNGMADPKIVFDHDSRRFFVIFQENTGSQFWLNVAVSKNDDPDTNGSDDWLFYRLNATRVAATNPAGGINYGGDYPGLAIDDRALYVTYRMYSFNPNGTLNGSGANGGNPSATLLILDKTQLLNGTASVVSLDRNAFEWQPVTPQGGTTANVMYLVENSGKDSITITSVTDPLGARTVAQVIFLIIDRGLGPSTGAPQLGSSLTVPTTNRTLGNATLVVSKEPGVGGDIWFCATRGFTGSNNAVAVFYRVRLNGWPTSGNNPAMIEDDTVGAAGDWNFCPAIGANQKGDVVITWTRSSSTIFPEMMCAWRTATDTSFGTPQSVHASETFNADGRWGDYFSCWPDPSDGGLWITSEWTRAASATWSTWWAKVEMPARDSYVNWFLVDPLHQNGTLANPWELVRSAHLDTTSGTIHIAPGHYNERITLNKKVTLVANGAGQVVIGAPAP